MAAPGCDGRSVALKVQVLERVLFTLRLWQDGTRALERALPALEYSPDRACLLRSMHRLAWTRLEAGLDESRSTSFIVMLAMER